MKIELKIIYLITVCLLVVTACSAVLEPQELDDRLVTDGQEAITVKYEPLTFEATLAASAETFSRYLVMPGIGARAGLKNENVVSQPNLPPANQHTLYRLGIGDELTFIQVNDSNVFSRDLGRQRANQNRSITSMAETSDDPRPTIVSDTLTSQTARIGADGSALYIGLGRLELVGKTLAEARNVVTNALIRTGGNPNFQLEISDFNSQHVLLSGNETSGAFPITEVPLSLRELLVTSGVSLSRTRGDGAESNSMFQRVRLVRGNREFSIPVDYLYSANSPSFYLQDKDHVIVESLNYKQSSVFLVGAVKTPKLIPISAEARQTLADVLFSEGGVLETVTTRKSEIYILRGLNPTVAWHLDAQNPARILIAAKMELRPNDIIFTTEKPLVSFGKTVGSLLQLRTFYNDIDS